MRSYLIIGNGVAAVGCIEGIRSVDKTTPITVVSKENHPVYGRPLISYYLEGRTTLEKMNYRPADFYEKNNCEVIYGVAEEIDTAGKTVTVGSYSLEYSSVCIATGSDAFVPPFEGLGSVEKQFTFMTLDDTLALEKELSPDKKVLIVGAGLIGLKCAEGIAQRVEKITVCDLATRVLSSILDDECASLMQVALEKNGIEFMLGDTAVRFENNKAVMKSGAEVDFDILILAVGVRANTQLAKACAVECNRGILVDNAMSTNVEGIYAAGDCTEGYDSISGERKVLAILPNAYMQGYIAGVNMAGGKKTLENAMAVNSIGFFGYHAMTAGYSPAGCETVEKKDGTSLRRFFIKDNRLTGFMLLGSTDRAGIYTALIRNKTPLDTVDFAAMIDSPSFVSYSADYRKTAFGGAK